MGAGTADSRVGAPWSVWLVPVVALAQAVVVLGPALGRGVVLRYDMVFSPDPRWTPFVLGFDTPAPRAVPSDAVAVLFGHVVGAELTQKAILLGLLVTLGLGAAALVSQVWPGVGVAARVGAVVAAVWNPFVQERLIVGQWTVLLGLSLLPWGMRAALRIADRSGGLWPLVVVVALAGLGGANTMVVVALPVVAALVGGIWHGAHRRGCARAAGAVILVGLGVSAAWVVPGLLGGIAVDAGSATAFLPTADSPLGVYGSLAGGGGFWNTATHPASRSVLIVAATAAAWGVLAQVAVFTRASGNHARILGWGLVVPTALVVVSVTPALGGLWAAMVTELPGGGVLRDSHKLMAPWVITSAVGLGVLVEYASSRLATLRAPVMAVLVGLPISLSPLLAWGAFGQLNAVVVPSEYRTAMEQLNGLPAGDVGLLPWSQYRRYAFNDERVSLTLVPRMATHTVLFDDSLPLRSGVIAGENSRAAAVSDAIDAGASPAQALVDSGVRYLVLEGSADPAGEADVRRAGEVVVESPSLLMVDVSDPEPATQGRQAVVAAWSGTLGTYLLLVLIAVAGRVARRENAGY